MPQTLSPGTDVTHLMDGAGGLPAGTDVTHLMAPSQVDFPQSVSDNGQILVTAPDKSTHYFSTQTAADRLKDMGSTAVSAGATPIDWPALAKQAGAFKSAVAPSAEPTPGPGPKMNFAVVNGQQVPVEDEPNTIGTLVSHLASQVNPITAVRTIGKALIPEAVARAAGATDDTAGSYGPLNALSHIGAAQGALFDKAKASYDKGDYVTAARHFVDYLIPLAGPAIDKSSDLFSAGKWAAGGGDALGIGLSMFGPKAIASARPQLGPLLENPNPEDAAAVAAGQAAGVPVDVATATGNRFVRGAQKLADESIGGSVVAQKADATTQAAMGKYGESLADAARPSSVTPEQAGQFVRDALTAKAQAHADLADHAYGQLRALEELPSNRMFMPLKPQAVDALADGVAGQLRRIVHELDAAPYTKRIIEPGKYGGDLQAVEGTGGAGAKVYDDIVQRSGSAATRGVLQGQLEAYLAGGPETSNVKAAIEVAKQRSRAGGGNTVSRPELPPSAMEVPTRLEKSRVTSEEMGLPVDLSGPKQALRPVYEQMRRQMPVTQQQASPGLKAIENILTGPGYAPLSQIDRDLSAIKAIARSQGGLAKLAVSRLDVAVRATAKAGTPDVAQALQQGRQATIAKVGTEALIEALPGGKLEEPIAVFNRATAPKDAGIELLRSVQEQTPQALSQIARAKLEDLMAMGPDKSFTEWSKLGPETKKILFPQTGQIPSLQQFFTLAKRLATNPNPSGSALTLWKGGEMTALATNPAYGIPYSIGMTTLSKMLHSPTVAKALTRSMAVSLSQAGTAAQAAAVADLVKAAHDAAIPLEALPKAADRGTKP